MEVPMEHDKMKDVNLPPVPRGWTREQAQTPRSRVGVAPIPVPGQRVGTEQGGVIGVRNQNKVGKNEVRNGGGHPPRTCGASLQPATLEQPAHDLGPGGGDCVESETDEGGVLGLCPPTSQHNTTCVTGVQPRNTTNTGCPIADNTTPPTCVTGTQGKIPAPPTCPTAVIPQPPPATGKSAVASREPVGNFKTTVQPCVNEVLGPDGGMVPVTTLPGNPPVEQGSNVISIKNRIWRRVIPPTPNTLPLSAIPPLPEGFKPVYYPIPGDKLNPAQVAEAIVLCGGWLSKVAASLGVTYKNIWEYSNKYPELKELIAEVKERNLDDCEDALMRRVRVGDTEAIKFWLKCQGKTRGWVERTEHAGVPDHPLTFIIKPASADDTPKAALPEATETNIDPDRFLQ